MLEYIGLTVVVPPMTSKRTIVLGTQYAPEFACLPLKINIGNFIEAKEHGADTFLMAGGVGPCRFGLYGQLEAEILGELGIDYDALIIEPPDKGIWQFVRRVRKITGSASWLRVLQGIHLGYRKACCIDSLERVVESVRPRERAEGTADRIFKQALSTIDRANNNTELEEAAGLARQKLQHIPQNEDMDVLKIGLVGEIYTLLEPFASGDVERKLGRMGAHVVRSIYLSDWVNGHLLGGFFRRKGQEEYKNYAKPYLNHFVGGHGIESIGAGVFFANNGFDGIIHIAPLTCMPEIVAHCIFPKVSEDLDIPVMTIYLDEQAGEEGLNTRLEAFVDLLARKREARETYRAI